MIVTLIRHGQTDWNLAGRIQGSTDIALNETGRQQARDAAAALDPSIATAVYSSDLQRANETARIIAAAHGWNGPHIIAPLRERFFGEAEGLYDHEFLERFGPWATAEVPGAETRAEIRVRISAALRDVVAHAESLGIDPTTRLIAVSHGAMIAELLRSLTDGAYPLPGEGIANGSAHDFFVTDDDIRWLSPVVAD